jgi:hypothetical protein
VEDIQWGVGSFGNNCSLSSKFMMSGVNESIKGNNAMYIVKVGF